MFHTPEPRPVVWLQSRGRPMPDAIAAVVEQSLLGNCRSESAMLQPAPPVAVFTPMMVFIDGG